MNTRKLGNSDLNLTTIGIGSFAMGGEGWKAAWGPQDAGEAVDAIRKGLECGINWIDTAAVYGFGSSEDLVGKAIAPLSEKPIIATKCGRVGNEERIWGELKKDQVKAECEASLKRLGIDIIDLYQIHWPDPEDDIEEAWTALTELKDEGKIRWPGVSNFTPEQMNRVADPHPVTSLQPPYSMFKRDIESEILPYCAEHNIGVVAYSPMQKGLLTGKMTRERVEAMPESDHRRRDPMFIEPQFTANEACVNALTQIASDLGITMAQLSIAWVLRDPTITSAIVGMRNPGQAAEPAAAGNILLTDDAVDAIESILSTRQDAVANL
jgi:aryl-alcohol dehydrogenase-like predicted oxidoreductase